MWLNFKVQCLKKRGFLEQGEAEDLQNFVQASLDPQFLFDDRHQHVHADGNPDLCLHGIVRRAVESFDPQMLLDPFEKQFHLPATLVEPRDGQRRQCEVVGQEHKPSSVLDVVKRNATQRVGIQPRRLRAGQHNRLVAAQSGRLVDRAMSAARKVEIPFASRDEEGGSPCEAMQTHEIDVAAIHHVERAGFDRQLVEDRHIVHFPVRNMHKTGNVAAQIQERVQLDGTLAAAKLRPREQAQAQVDGRGVERIDGLFEIDGQWVLRIQPPRAANQHLGEIGVDPPIVSAIRSRQGAARDLSAKSRVVQFRSQRSQARFDVPQAFAKRELREPQAKELIATGETARATIAPVPVDAIVEFASRQEIHELCEYELSVEHKTPWARKGSPRQGSSVFAISSRVHAFFDATDCDCRS